MEPAAGRLNQTENASIRNVNRYHGQLHWIRWLGGYRMQSVVLKKSSLFGYKMELAFDNRVHAYYAEQTVL